MPLLAVRTGLRLHLTFPHVYSFVLGKHILELLTGKNISDYTSVFLSIISLIILNTD